MILPLLFIVIILMLFELLYIRIANRFRIIDKPNSRSSHKSITLRGGGIIFLIGVWLFEIFFEVQYPWFLTGLTLIAIFGFIDDVHSLPNNIRLIIQSVAIVFLIYQLGIQRAPELFIFVLIICVGIINAYNFMDGINGMTGGYSLAIIIPLTFINNRISFIDPNLLYVTIISIFVFCCFNFRKKAICFAGDVGSLSIAYITIFILARLILQTGNITYILFLALYGVDSLLTICHRILLHENLGTAHRKHAYQIMANELGIPHVVISSIYMVTQFIISMGLILLPVNHWLYVGLVLSLLAVAYVFFIKKYYPLHEAYLKSKHN